MRRHAVCKTKCMPDELARLRRKLCRELAQSELDAAVHTRREAERLGEGPHAVALLEISAHATSLRPRLDALLIPRQPFGVRAGRAVGHTFSTLRHLIFDRMISAERSYRGTLLGLWHGVDTARLLRAVAWHAHEIRLHRFCDDLIAQREPLIRQAEDALRWFASHPDLALAKRVRTSAPARPMLEDRA
jgi:hypothetical protein